MARPLPPRADIVACLSESAKPLHPRELAEKLGVAQGSVKLLHELLDQLCLDGAIQPVGSNRFKVKPLAERNATWEGMLNMNPRGFGFVVAAGQVDVYIPNDSVGAALHGDKVSVSVVNRSARGSEGRIEEIVARRNPRIAGVLRRRGSSSWLEPDDVRLRGPIVISHGSVLGKDGEAAVVEISRFPRFAEETPEGHVIAVLGLPGEAKTEVAKILLREQINEEHPAAAIQEAEAMAARLREQVGAGRRDLRAVPLPTIDPADARDHDDALWVERRGDGFRAYIAIADVSEYVTPGSALDEEARHRGCTTYLPDRAIPMLPAALAADLCSLLPECERLCLCVIADLDQQGVVTSFEIVEGVMRSAAMLTYDGVARALGFTEQGQRSVQAEAMKEDLRALDDLACKLRNARMTRGALDLNLPEARVVLDPETGRPKDVVRRAQDPGVKRAYQMVEELMLLANELVAEWLSSQRVVTIYRVHAVPDAEKLERLAKVAQELDVKLDVNELLEPQGLSRWLQHIQEHPRKNVLESVTLRSLKQAFYDIVNVGHFGLASDRYLHFTSPIRRYPDLVVHRTVKSILRGDKPKGTPAEVEAARSAATASSVRERSVMEVEREVVDLYRALLMRERIGEEFDGTITALVGTGIFVALDAPFVDVLVRYESLGEEPFELTESELAVRGTVSGELIHLGSRIRIVVDDVAILRRSVYGRRVLPAQAARRGGSPFFGKREPAASAAPPQRGRIALPEGRRPVGRVAADAKHSPSAGKSRPSAAKPSKSRPSAAKPSKRGR